MTLHIIKELSALLMLSTAAFEDVRHKSVHIAIPVIGFVAGVSFLFFEREVQIPQVIMSLLPGLFLLLMSILLRGQVGTGDGVVLLVLGLIGGRDTALCTFLQGMIYSGLVALLLLIKRRPKDATLPFIPFLLAGYVTAIALQ